VTVWALWALWACQRAGVRHHRAERGTPRARCGVIAKDFAFRGISAANELSDYRDHGPGRGAGWTNRTKRARARSARELSSRLQARASRRGVSMSAKTSDRMQRTG
jgi:hypothetical protein